MGKDKTCFLVVCLVFWWGCLTGQPVLEQQPVLERTTELRKKVVELAQDQVGVRELTGNNDGKQVEQYLRSVGLRKGNAWCAAFVSWLHIQFNIPNPESGWSPDWFRNNLVYLKPQKRFLPFVSRPGQVCGLWFETKGRIAHVGMIINETRFHYITIEGNTNIAGSREGDGVYGKIRKKETIYAISDFVGWKEYLEGVKNLK